MRVRNYNLSTFEHEIVNLGLRRIFSLSGNRETWVETLETVLTRVSLTVIDIRLLSNGLHREHCSCSPCTFRGESSFGNVQRLSFSPLVVFYDGKLLHSCI